MKAHAKTSGGWRLASAGRRHRVSTLRNVLLAVLAVALAPGTSDALTQFRVQGQVIANGGGWGFNATQGSNGTAGQSIAGWGSRLFFSDCSGFWCFGGARVVGVGDGGGEGGDPGGGVPRVLSLGAPTPNPTRGDVRFTLGLPAEADIEFTVFDVAGRQLGDAIHEHLAAGVHRLRWSAPANHSGVYFGLLRVDGATREERRIVLVR